ncbi:MAG: DUF368 domain-containing protein [Bacilli bacterium]|jgi:putative membrane protein
MQNNIFKKIIQGIIVGFAFIIGMGGGTVAVLMGIYDDLVKGIADFNKKPRESFRLLWPWGVGAILGAALLLYPIKLALEHFPLPVTALVVGLTAGGLREITKITRKENSLKNILLAIIAMSIAVGIGVISWFSVSSGVLDTLSFGKLSLVFGIGAIESVAIVAPGISGTQFLLAIGYLDAILGLIVGLFSGGNITTNLIFILVLGLGFLIGLIFISKIMNFFLTKYRASTYFVLLGFIVGSFFACFFNGDIKTAYSIFTPWTAKTLWMVISGVVCLVVGFFVSYFLLKFVEKREEESSEFTVIEEEK